MNRQFRPGVYAGSASRKETPGLETLPGKELFIHVSERGHFDATLFCPNASENLSWRYRSALSIAAPRWLPASSGADRCPHAAFSVSTSSTHWDTARCVCTSLSSLVREMVDRSGALSSNAIRSRLTNPAAAVAAPHQPRRVARGNPRRSS